MENTSVPCNSNFRYCFKGFEADFALKLKAERGVLVCILHVRSGVEEI